MEVHAPGETADAREFRDTVRSFAQEVIAPHATAIDATNNFPKDVNLWRAMGDMGLHGGWVQWCCEGHEHWGGAIADGGGRDVRCRSRSFRRGGASWPA